MDVPDLKLLRLRHCKNMSTWWYWGRCLSWSQIDVSECKWVTTYNNRSYQRSSSDNCVPILPCHPPLFADLDLTFKYSTCKTRLKVCILLMCSDIEGLTAHAQYVFLLCQSHDKRSDTMVRKKIVPFWEWQMIGNKWLFTTSGGQNSPPTLFPRFQRIWALRTWGQEGETTGQKCGPLLCFHSPFVNDWTYLITLPCLENAFQPIFKVIPFWEQAFAQFHLDSGEPFC